MHGGGIISYGDISLDPETGAFVGGSMSEGRLTSMIKEMRFVSLLVAFFITDCASMIPSTSPWPPGLYAKAFQWKARN